MLQLPKAEATPVSAPVPAPATAAPQAPASPASTQEPSAAQGLPAGDGFDATPPNYNQISGQSAPSQGERPVDEPVSTRPPMKLDDFEAYEQLSEQDKKLYDSLYREATSQARAYGPSKDRLVEMLRSGEFGNYAKIERAIAGTRQPWQSDVVPDLRELLFSGRLTNQQARNQGNNLFQYLQEMAEGSPPGQRITGQGVDLHRLLTQTVREIAHPDRISQGRGNQDCGGTAAATILAVTNPAEYARILKELAVEGRAELPSSGGPQEFLKLTAMDPNDTRPITQKLFAASVVQAANGETREIDDLFGDERRGNDLLRGLKGNQLADVLEGFIGGEWNVAQVPGAGELLEADLDPSYRKKAEDAAKQILTEQLRRGVQPIVNLNGHYVVVTQVNPWFDVVKVRKGNGQEEYIPMKDFFSKLNSVLYREDVGMTFNPGWEWMLNPAWDDRGGGYNGAAGNDGSGDRSRA